MSGLHRRQADLDALGAMMRTIAAGSPVETEADAFAAMLQSRPVLAVRATSTTAEMTDMADRIAALLAPALPGVAVTAEGHPTRPLAEDDSGLADWWVVVTSRFEPHDPVTFDALRDRCAAPSRTTVLVDTTELVAHVHDDAVLRLIARRVHTVDVDLWSRAAAVTDADSRALAALSIGGDDLAEDLTSASRFVRDHTGRAAEVRSRLFDRLGMRGLRQVLPDPDPSFGADGLRDTLRRAAGADVALATLASDVTAAWPAPRELRAVAAATILVESMRAHDRRRARDMAEALQRFEQGSEATMADVLRRWHGVATIVLRDDLQADIERIVDGATMRDRIGVDASVPDGDALIIATAGVKRWRAFAAGPLVASPVAAFADAVAQWFEIACASLTPSPT